MLPNNIGVAAYKAGIHDVTALATAVTIAMAESGGNEHAHNAVPPDDSYGLWQINMLGDLGPARRAKYGLKANSDLYDPDVNARVMADLSGKGSNWKPWTTYNGARYKLLYPVGLAAATWVMGNYVPVAGAASAAQGAVDAAGQLANAVTAGVNQVGKVGAWLADRNNQFRMVKVAAGVILVGVALSAAARPFAMKAAGQVVQTVVPVGKAGKAVSSAVGGMKK